MERKRGIKKEPEALVNVTIATRTIEEPENSHYWSTKLVRGI